MNQYETQMMRESLINSGFTERNVSDKADYYIVNSCTVTHKADQDVRNMIGYFNKVNPSGKIVVAGCYAELDNDRRELRKLPGVFCFIRNSEKEHIARMLFRQRFRY